MKLSFRFKIALISFAVSGTLLAAFGMIFFTFVYRSGIDRIDREIRSLVEVPLRGGHPSHYWADFGKSLEFIYGESRTDRIALLVIDADDQVLFESENTPVLLAVLPRPKLPTPPANDNQRRKQLNAPSPSRGPSTENLGFLERHDANLDGKVSRSEFPGPDHAFNRTDADLNGFIEADEINRVPLPPMRRDGPPGVRTPPPGENRDAPKLPMVTRFQSMETLSANWRTGIFRTPEITIIAAMDMDSFQVDVHRFQNAFMVAVPLGLLLLGVTGWFLASRAMRPVAIIADTAEGITAKGLDRRIPMVGNDVELERLVSVSNNMLDRLEKSYHQAVRFSADAAHELQTPLTILQGELDNAIQASEDGSKEQQNYSMLLEELRNLKAVVQKLLLLAHADEGRLNINLQPVNLSELIHNATEDIEIMAPELKIEQRIVDGITVSADAALLNQAIRNMTSNAAKYATEKGTAVFTLEQDNQAIRFTLANTAGPIPDEDRHLLFERFHRVEKSRTASGSGLGLSLAREIARAHGGDLSLGPYENGMVAFSLSLPPQQA